MFRRAPVSVQTGNWPPILLRRCKSNQRFGMIMRMLRAPTTPNAAAESGQPIRSSLAVRVRIWEELPENERSFRKAKRPATFGRADPWRALRHGCRDN